LTDKNGIWRLYFSLCALVLLILSVKPLYGQNQQIAATLGGTVTDQQGLAIPNATVTLSNAEHGFSRNFTTDASGNYSFTFLPAAVYVLQVTAPGFREYIQNGLNLEAGANAQQNVILVVGAVTQRIEITSEAPLVNTVNANVGSELAAGRIEDLPINWRSIISLSMLNSSVSNVAEGAPGTGTGGTADQDVSQLNFGGTFIDSAMIMVDGTYDSREDWGGDLYVPSVDAVEEFRIQTNTFTAQYGYSSGNIINIVTKSGSDKFHGDAYEFYRNAATDARGFFLKGAAQPSFTRNQFGGTVGGPIRKKDTYFFGYYEGLRQAAAAVDTTTVPTAAERTGNFQVLLGSSSVGTDALGRAIYAGQLYNPFTTRAITSGVVDPVSGLKATSTGYIRDPIGASPSLLNPTASNTDNILPANFIDPIGSALANNYWPLPTGSGLSSNIAPVALQPEHSNEYEIRVDHNFSNNDRVFVRWARKWEVKTGTPFYYGPTDPGGPGLTNPNNRWSASASWTHVFSPSFAMNLNSGVNRHIEGGVTQGAGFQQSTMGFPSWMNGYTEAFPEVTETGYAYLGASGGNNNYITPQAPWTTSVDFTKQKGEHQLGFGFMHLWQPIDGGHVGLTNLEFDQAWSGGPNPQKATSGTGNSIADMIMGVGSYTLTNNTNYSFFPASTKHYFHTYVQDDWKVTRKLTLNPGVSWDIQTAQTERHNAQQEFNYTGTNPISTSVGFTVPGFLVYNTASHRGLYNAPLTNFAPRMGLAYQLRDKLVFRAGYGVFFVPNYYSRGGTLGFSQATTWVTSTNGGLNPSSTMAGNASLGLGPAFTTPTIAPGGANGALTLLGQAVSGINVNRPTPYLEQWMGGLQYAFSPASMLEVNYVGNYGVHEGPSSLNAGQLTPAEMALGTALNTAVPNPFFGYITGSACGTSSATVVESQLLRPYPEFCGVSQTEPISGNSNYNALQANFRHRWRGGLDLNLSYTFSKFMSEVEGDNGTLAYTGYSASFENPYNLRNERSVDTVDTPNAFVANYDYELPMGRGKRFGGTWSRPLNGILGGWQTSGVLTARSGLPLSIEANSNNSNSDGGFQRPNVVPGVSPKATNPSPAMWVNSAAYAEPAAYTFGNAPRLQSYFRGPRYFVWDAGVMKNWKLGETMKIQFRFEMFNCLNHPNFRYPDMNLADISTTFGQITSAFANRTVQYSAKFYF
jgi:hypothetical protein